ncbi:histidine phosphatase family protein [Nocardia asiatica]|uniref:histidine phosphatase family protein n=1 Tax=Nocardia asiatica TaxID=209252 RepID=UPI0002EB1EE2|nr:histidine phosphatase family protein [Nocardia asiatica]
MTSTVGGLSSGHHQSERPSVPVPNLIDGIAPVYAITDLRVIRHGQSTANVAFASPNTDLPLPGRDAEVKLSSLGHEQAVALGGWLAGLDESERPQLTVCSPYLRARQTWAVMARTAEAINPGSGSVRTLIDERLRDREMGVFELHPPAAIRVIASNEVERRDRVGEWFYRPPGGESLADVCLRIRDILNEVDRTCGAIRVLMIAHDAVAAAVRQIAAGVGALPPAELDVVSNGSISRWQSDDGRLRVTEWSNTDHLPEEVKR